MHDISKCRNKDCKKSKKCYRFTAKDCEFMQGYSDFKPDKNGYCEYYWYNKK